MDLEKEPDLPNLIKAGHGCTVTGDRRHPVEYDTAQSPCAVQLWWW